MKRQRLIYARQIQNAEYLFTRFGAELLRLVVFAAYNTNLFALIYKAARNFGVCAVEVNQISLVPYLNQFFKNGEIRELIT